MIQAARVQPLNDRPVRQGHHVLWWVQASHRSRCNHALEFAVRQANAAGLPVVACFGLTDAYPEANLRHYAFLVEGLAALGAGLRGRGVQLVVRLGDPAAVALDLAAEAAQVVADAGYLRHQRAWRDRVADEAACRVTQVETDVVVPVETASVREEYSAATLRPRLQRQLDRFLVPLREEPLRRDSLALRLGGVDLTRTEAVLGNLRVDQSVPVSPIFRGGQDEAHRRLDAFVAERLTDYHRRRREPADDWTSHLSPYLHFGHISPLEVALAVRAAQGVPEEAKAAFLEELIVRRELGVNYVHFQPRYDAFDVLPAWARQTLEVHRRDRRPALYDRAQLEDGHTDDPYWNAAQHEMLRTGYMHNTLRMYWGKKLLEWHADPAQAFATAMEVNNRWFLDGRDPASYANVAWLFGKHDRPWGERPVFGKVRCMNAAGLERKFDIAAYVRRVEALREATAAPSAATPAPPAAARGTRRGTGG